MDKKLSGNGCLPGNCGCGPQIDRRHFIRVVGLGATTYLVGSTPIMAGPFETAEFEKLIPVDKKLQPDWVKSLFDRGSRTIYRGEELKYIGMPIGGLCSGQLYLGGDGKLWYWDIFNKFFFTGYAAPTYEHPRIPSSPIDQGFTLKVKEAGGDKTRSLDSAGFSDISFNGEYPIGFVEYKDPACPVAVSLEAFSPFAPLATDDSSLPATVMRYTLRNIGSSPVEVELTGHLENGAAVHSRYNFGSKGNWQNQIARDGDLLQLKCGIKALDSAPPPSPARPTIVFADFEGADYGPWKAEGDAFEKSPASQPPTEQRVTNYQGKSFANTYHGPNGDATLGKLISPEFDVERAFINFLIAGGNKPGQTCINLLVDGNIVRSSAPREDGEKMEWQGWDVREYEGKKAHIEIVDQATGGWGHIEIDQIQFEDVSQLPAYASDMYDFGTMSLALLQAGDADSGAADATDGSASADRPVDAAKKMVGSVTRKVTLQPGQTDTAAFVIAWHFPNFGHGQNNHEFRNSEGRYYATQFADAHAVAKYVSDNFERLHGQTKTWHATWYDSTLPYWFLDRTIVNVSTLATSTAYRFANGNFYGWEGVGCCGGTCTHVWSYEQAMGRLFPDFDRLLRDRTDYHPGAALCPDGQIGNRGGTGAATDGQAGTILRTLRDHQTSADDAFLKRNWTNIKLALGWLIAQDGNDDGILEGPQPNTMDETWYGAVPWMSGLYLAALRAGEEMAHDMGDEDFAKKCRSIFDVGQKKFVSMLWDEEAGYFIQTRDPQHKDVRGSYNGCEVDQVYGQSWGFQVGLGRILPERETKQALASLWKYNFAPDVGPYAKVYNGQAYALAGEAGLLICTWPQVVGKREECNYCDLIFAGIEHHVAGHMIWEGMLMEGLALERAVHDRYHPLKRNPWNEVECGDHYARSMASYGAFIAMSGFEYHGPKGTMAFAPRLVPENFRSAFTAAEGWGAFAQAAHGDALKASLEVKWGKVELKTLTLTPLKPGTKGTAMATLNGQSIPSTARLENNRVVIDLKERLTLSTHQKLEVIVS
jgi:non-lysosomal glucosylceramidase